MPFVSRFVLAGTVVAVLAVAFGAVHLTRPAWYQRLWYPLRYEEIVRGHAAHYRLDPALLAAVIYQESKFNADARSRSGAVGLMQLLPSTAEGIAARTGGTRFRVNDLYGPEINIRYGAWYPAICSTSTGTSTSRWPPTTPASTTSTSGCAGGRGSPSRRRGGTSTTSST